MKKKIIALFGPSGSGKDTIRKALLNDKEIKNILHNVKSYTTRPKREGEEDTYFFISEQDFAHLILNGEMLEASIFHPMEGVSWYYGTGEKSLDEDKINIGIFNLDGLENIILDPEFIVFPIYLQAPDKVRLMRSLNREESPDCHEICRRFLADSKDFHNGNILDFEWECFVVDASKSVSEVCDQIKKLITLFKKD